MCVCVDWTCWRGSSVDTKSTRLVGSVYAAALEIMLYIYVVKVQYVVTLQREEYVVQIHSLCI